MLTIYSADHTKADLYLMRITAKYEGYTNIAVLDFQVTVLDACAAATLSINDDILTSLAISYDIGSAQHDETFDEAEVTATPPVTGCPAVEYSVTD